MQANTSQSFVDLLRRKDEQVEDLDKFGYDYVRKNKNAYLIGLEERAQYEHNVAGACVKPCLKSLTTPVVTTEESECMTACIAKAYETRAMFDYYGVKSKRI